jgi:hypothetical protein
VRYLVRQANIIIVSCREYISRVDINIELATVDGGLWRIYVNCNSEVLSAKTFSAGSSALGFGLRRLEVVFLGNSFTYGMNFIPPR